MKYKKLIVLACVLLLIIFAGSKIISTSDSDHTDHDEHENKHEHEDCDGHEEGQVIELSKEQIEEIGIELATATGGKIEVYVKNDYSIES